MRHENLVSNQLEKFKLSPFQKIEKLTFSALALPQSEKKELYAVYFGRGEAVSFTVEGKICLKFFFEGWSGTEEVSLKMHLGKFLAFSWHLSGKDLFTSVHFKLLHSHTHIFYSLSRQQQVQN